MSARRTRGSCGTESSVEPRPARCWPGAHLLACTSTIEGGANVVTEAIALGVPVVGTRIDGNVGLLGPDYPAFVPVGDDEALARIIACAETDRGYYADLEARVAGLQPRTEPAHEREQWAAVLS